ncbi:MULTISPECIES: acyl-CoA dehydrogenase family protein [unclassified Novosphingobium]|uniref:acyl-CoA dehydrogenase family protein n=1 Tax=unclassified Novosphingobium TaxID=2644732 RepID=UPI00135B01CF|nr:MULTISPECIES: acyl-CoA dehydrogenase family protein [unclassified Novosphingobium]
MAVQTAHDSGSFVERDIFEPEHDAYRDSVRRFVETELQPHHAQWEKDGIVPREAWLKAGEIGMLCPSVPEEYGGIGADFLYSVVMIEEITRANVTGPGFMVHSEMVAPYILAWGSEETKRQWLPRMVTGEVIGALGMTEPGAGSDAKELRTRAELQGDEYVINGQKTYISNGSQCDLVVLACKTDPTAGARGVSLIVVEADQPGFERGRRLEKIGLKAQDTAELFFNDARAPVSSRLGEEGKGFGMLMGKLAQERLSIGVKGLAACEAALRWTADYVQERKLFGQMLGDMQNTQFVLAQLCAEVSQGRIMVDWGIRRFMAGKLSAVDASKIKLLATELNGRVVDQCLQFFGGYGYMTEYPISQAFVDARISRIAGGANEVMRQIIARDLFRA